MELRRMIEVVVEAGRVISIKRKHLICVSGAFVNYAEARIVVVLLHEHTLVTALLYLADEIALTSLPADGNIFNYIKPSEGKVWN